MHPFNQRLKQSGKEWISKRIGKNGYGVTGQTFRHYDEGLVPLIPIRTRHFLLAHPYTRYSMK